MTDMTGSDNDNVMTMTGSPRPCAGGLPVQAQLGGVLLVLGCKTGRCLLRQVPGIEAKFQHESTRISRSLTKRVQN